MAPTNTTPFETERRELSEKMRTKEAREIYKRRKETVEPAIGHLEENLGLRSFLKKGLTSVRSESHLACTVFNMKKIWILRQKKQDENRLFSYDFSSLFFFDKDREHESNCQTAYLWQGSCHKKFISYERHITSESSFSSLSNTHTKHIETPR